MPLQSECFRGKLIVVAQKEPGEGDLSRRVFNRLKRELRVSTHPILIVLLQRFSVIQDDGDGSDGLRLHDRLDDRRTLCVERRVLLRSVDHPHLCRIVS